MKPESILIIISVSCLFCFSQCSTSKRGKGAPIDERVLGHEASVVKIPGFSIGESLATEDFSGNLDQWMVEGKVLARIENGKLLFESSDREIENPKGNIWWKVDIQSPYILEFDYQSLTAYGLSMIFWNACGLDNRDVFSWTRTGKYEEYINGNMQAYHVSFHRFGSGKSNIRKAPGFHLVSSVEDPVPLADTSLHRIAIACTGNHQRIYIDGTLFHDFIDEKLPCLNDQEWQHGIPCTGTGDIPERGAIGIRHIQKQKAYYDNFRVCRLLPSGSQRYEKE